MSETVTVPDEADGPPDLAVRRVDMLDWPADLFSDNVSDAELLAEDACVPGDRSLASLFHLHLMAAA